VTRVCLVGDEDVELRYELLSRETAREALSTYDLDQPYDNTVALSTVSVGAAVTLCNDLNWYLVRFVDEAWIRDPSIDDEEWLSRDLAAAVRNDECSAEESAHYCKVYGVVDPDPDDEPGAVPDGPELVEPLYVTRSDGSLPEYDLREVSDTVVVRVTEEEFAS